MSLTLKILLAADAFFALLLIVYLGVKYGKIFSKRPESFKLEKANGTQEEVEVTYEEEPAPIKTEAIDITVVEEVKETSEGQPTLDVEEEKEQEIASTTQEEEKEEVEKEEALTIGSFEELESIVSSAENNK